MHSATRYMTYVNIVLDNGTEKEASVASNAFFRVPQVMSVLDEEKSNKKGTAQVSRGSSEHTGVAWRC